MNDWYCYFSSLDQFYFFLGSICFQLISSYMIFHAHVFFFCQNEAFLELHHVNMMLFVCVDFVVKSYLTQHHLFYNSCLNKLIFLGFFQCNMTGNDGLIWSDCFDLDSSFLWSMSWVAYFVRWGDQLTRSIRHFHELRTFQ